MKKNLLFISVVMITMSFMTDNQEKDNTLSKKEKKEGWVLLFDGTTMTGWRSYKNKEQEGWSVKDGELYCKAEGVTKRADLITALYWRAAPGSANQCASGSRTSVTSAPPSRRTR